jgi:hypothetical protein
MPAHHPPPVDRRRFLGTASAAALAEFAPPTTGPAVAADRPFVHPGLLHTRADLDRMKEQVARQAEPWWGGFRKLRDHPQSRADWKPRGPFETVVRGPKESRHVAELARDANAAYQNALMWAVTGEPAAARTAVEILDAWSGTLREVAGKDAILGASICGFKLANAAEILRHTDAGWRPEDARRAGRMLRDVFLPVVRDFAPFANGNWDAGCIKTVLAVGVFCDDREVYDRGVDYYRAGRGNGRLTHYVVNEAGQCQESGRDQQHAQLGLGHLAEACEVAWSQGLDLYGAADDRLLKGFEYTARYNLGQDVPFVPFTDTTGKYTAKAISAEGRGRLRPIYEMVFNHYERRRGVPAPFTRRAAEQLRPEGAAFDADHPGFGTLLFTRPAARPGGG